MDRGIYSARIIPYHVFPNIYVNVNVNIYITIEDAKIMRHRRLTGLGSD